MTLRGNATATTTTTGHSDSLTATWGVVLGITGIVLGIVGIGFGVLNRQQRRGTVAD